MDQEDQRIYNAIRNAYISKGNKELANLDVEKMALGYNIAKDMNERYGWNFSKVMLVAHETLLAEQKQLERDRANDKEVLDILTKNGLMDNDNSKKSDNPKFTAEKNIDKLDHEFDRLPEGKSNFGYVDHGFGGIGRGRL